jgi:hypothetical protein
MHQILISDVLRDALAQITLAQVCGNGNGTNPRCILRVGTDEISRLSRKAKTTLA